MVDFNKMLQKNRGKFEKFVFIDCETSGMSFGGNPSKDYQAVSWGMVISDIHTFEPQEELYIEIKWNGHAYWNDKAESIHGMSKEYLDKHGITETVAAEQIGGFLYDNFGLDNPIVVGGHNPGTFDLEFLKKLLTAHELPFKFAHRTMDSFALAMGTVQTFNSDDLFELVGIAKRDKHNALDDAKAALQAYKIINKMWKTYIG